MINIPRYWHRIPVLGLRTLMRVALFRLCRAVATSAKSAAPQKHSRYPIAVATSSSLGH